MTRKKTEMKALCKLHRVAVNSEMLKARLREGLGAKVCREARGPLACRAFGEVVGVTGQYINRVERGHDIPSVAFFAKVVAFLLAARGR